MTILEIAERHDAPFDLEFAPIRRVGDARASTPEESAWPRT